MTITITITVTGPRRQHLFGFDTNSAKYNHIREFIQDELKILTEDKQRVTLITGMALGVDQIFCEEAIKFRKNNKTKKKVEIFGYIPCKEQSKFWRKDQIMKYNSLLSQIVPIFVQEHYTLDCMQKRNEKMVDKADIILGIYYKKAGGTRNCLVYAYKQNKKIITMNPITGEINNYND